MVAAAGLVCACALPEPIDTLEPPAPVQITSVGPSTLLPGSRIIVTGTNLSATAEHTLVLAGSVAAKGGAGPRTASAELDLATSTPQRAEAALDGSAFALLGEGTFQGTASVRSMNTIGETRGPAWPATFVLVRKLVPTLTEAGAGVVHLNSKVAVVGAGFLLGGKEGQTSAELKGCFLKALASGTCETAGSAITASVTLKPQSDTDRSRAYFEFAPSIAGITPGAFKGTLALANRHADGRVERSAPLAATFQLLRTRIHRLEPGSVALGQYLELKGAGFVGGTGSSTVVRFAGTFAPKTGTSRQVQADLVLAAQEGAWARYVLEESHGLGSVINLRQEPGTLSGTWTPTVYWNGQSEQGEATTLSLKLAGVKQVVWVRYTGSWSESLRRFGLLAADASVRKRVLEVMRRDYGGINIEFHETEPQDFKLYVKLDLSGKDPNGLGLLGYDNTPGKDVGNVRLYDWLGGVNALTQQDGFPGYGGVFLESLLGFSEHPPAGVQKSPLVTPLFDQIFDAFRPDVGQELTAAEALAAAASAASAASVCPVAASADRTARAACAIRTMANVVGSTATHELGHSLGLAEPYGQKTVYHNPGDLPNRLMEAGQDRPFDERAELAGKGPAVFCDQEYAYLKKILPRDPAADPKVTRPRCD